MKIALVTLNSKFIHSNLSLWCLKSGVEHFCKNNHEIRVFESTINKSHDDLLQKLDEFHPDILACSCYIWNTEKLLEIYRIFKQKSNCIIALGGPEVEFCKEDILYGYKFVDYIVSGEGEWSFSSLVDFLNGDKLWDDCEGISYLECDKIISLQAMPHAITPPSPYCKEYFDSLNGRIAYIEASRGCPFNCSYCLSGRLCGLRYFDFEQITDNIVNLYNSGTETIKFIDRTFNADATKANRILSFIKDNFSDNRNNVCFHFEMAADILKEETLKILSEMPVGLCQLEIGIQSFNEKTLVAVNRKTDLIKVQRNITELLSYKNMHIHIDLIAGLPYEDINSFRNSFNMAFALKASMLQLGFLKMLHGADIRKSATDYDAHFSAKAPYEIHSNKWLSEDNLKELKMCEDALDRLYNSSRFLNTIDFLLKETGWTPYDLFSRFGASGDFNKISLSDYSEKIYLYFRSYVNEVKLKEAILIDLNSLQVNIHIPDVLIDKDIRYKTIKKYFTEKLQKNVRIVILHSKNKVFVVHTDICDKISGRYFGEYCDIPI